jgi:prepilin-type processing-associated H-X9-DG protein
MYLDDNRRYFPDTLEWLYTDSPSGYCMWHDRANNLLNHPEYGGVLWPYLREADVHVCPSFKMVTRLKGYCSNPGHNPSIRIEPQYSYSMNAFVGGDGKGMVPHESQVKHPSRVFIFSEENSWVIPGLSGNGCGINDNNLRIGIPPDLVDCFATYHNPPHGDFDKGSANLVFVDGHIDSIEAAEQYDGANFKLAWPRAALPGSD